MLSVALLNVRIQVPCRRHAAGLAPFLCPFPPTVYHNQFSLQQYMQGHSQLSRELASWHHMCKQFIFCCHFSLECLLQVCSRADKLFDMQMASAMGCLSWTHAFRYFLLDDTESKQSQLQLMQGELESRTQDLWELMDADQRTRCISISECSAGSILMACVCSLGSVSHLSQGQIEVCCDLRI